MLSKSQSVKVLKEVLCECVTNYNLNINVDEVLKSVDEEIDIDKFKDWFELKVEYFKSKQNQTSYFIRAFREKLEKGTFKVETPTDRTPNTTPLINELRSKGITVTSSDTIFIDVLFSYLTEKKHVDSEWCRDINKRIIEYMKTDRFSEYEVLVRQAKTLKLLNVDWDYIDQKVTSEINEWKSLINEIEEREVVYDREAKEIYQIPR